ncbi:succinate dehydrogenase, cytochrome b556 subunit [Pyrobaculum aerophilum]|uniref:Succinate dehydrogenase cytochrome b subunit (SdhC) n=2 Tax=Pyrobaculum aerophilum TaxID=13773 RepID=Q8ZYL8_PYRAE|nr:MULTISPECIES: succinate dehydrogenase [Pyrobaculum]AAL62975.1 succinate dehydrogenase cytochrome b subunit (sdhC) [Pyrobaculum aerophilum str. IM2]MCX8137685.1 succinate dehydrogenase [Pyrobaculum aerophilum]HII46111.1 succinate dehydrogenase [Pyrobaculum aerophilum]
MRAGMGIGEWFRRLNYERLFFILHRLTAIYLVLYIFPRPYLVLLYGSWEEALKLDMTPIGKILAAIFVFSILFHGINGLRLVLIELGIIKGWPVRDPISPRPALRASAAHKLLIALTVIGTIIGSALGIYLVAYGAETWP